MKIVNKILELGGENIISILSVFIAMITLFVSIIFNIKTTKQYIQSLSPLLSFRLIEYDSILYLSITNTGQSEARNIKIVIDGLFNNGNNNKLMVDDLFNNIFELYPNEAVQGMIGIYNLGISSDAFPYVKLDVSYIKGNDNKKCKHIRKISFTKSHEKKIKADVSIDTREIEDNLNSLAHSNNRVANYIESRTLFTSDRLNVFPHNSLYKDMKDAFNNIEREEVENNELNKKYKIKAVNKKVKYKKVKI